MTTGGHSNLRVFLRISLVGFMLCSINACATGPKEVRSHLDVMDAHRLATGAMTYIFFVPPARAHVAVEAVLRDNFAISYFRKQQQTDLEQYSMFSEIGTKFFQYEENGKKYRKKCEATVYVIPEYPDYSRVLMSCIFDVYELGIIHGRGGIHNIFNMWWDWYPERGLYVAEDLLELVSKKLNLKKGEVIRLIEKGGYSKEELLEHIQNAPRNR